MNSKSRESVYSGIGSKARVEATSLRTHRSLRIPRSTFRTPSDRSLLGIFPSCAHGFIGTALVKSVAPNRRGGAVPVEAMHAHRAEYVRGQSTAIGVQCCLPDSWRGARLPPALGLPGLNGAWFLVIEASRLLAEAPPLGPRRIHFGAPGRKQEIAAADP